MVKITDLPLAGALNGTEMSAVVQAGAMKLAPTNDLSNLANQKLAAQLDGVAWIKAEALSLTWTTQQIQIAKAIKYVRMEGGGFDPADTYYISIFCKNDGTFGDRIAVRRSSDNAIINALSSVTNNKPAGAVTEIVLTSDTAGLTSQIEITLGIAYDEITTTGILLNTASATPLQFSLSSCRHGARQAARGRQNIRNIALDPAGANQTGVYQILGTPPAQAAANAALAAFGIVRSHPVGTGTTATTLWKREQLPANSGGRWFNGGFFIYSANGTSWPALSSVHVYPYAVASGGTDLAGSQRLLKDFIQINANVRWYFVRALLPANTVSVAYGLNSVISGGAAEIGGWSNTVSSVPLDILALDRTDWTGWSTRDAWRDGVDTSLAGLANGVVAARTPSYLFNEADNPPLSPDGAAPIWTVNSGGSVTLAQPTNPALRMRGIERMAKFGSDTATGFFVYKDEEVTADYADRNAFASFYVWSENGTNYGSPAVFFYNSSGGQISSGIPMSFDQIDANTRRYFWAGKLPNDPAIRRVRYGPGSRVSACQCEFGGFSFFTSALASLTRDNTPLDQWYPSGASTKAIAAGLARLDAIASEQAAAARSIRAAFMGSSITWGGGYLGEDSYVGLVERRLREKFATTLMASAMTLTGTSSQVSGKNWYRGAVTKLSGIGASASCTLTGDEFSIAIGRERGNVGAALIQLYVDGVLYDTFSTVNNEPYATGLTASFTGDGTTKLFDLGRCWTFAHVVTVAGSARTGTIYSGGYGGTIPAGDDYMVVKQLVMVSGKPEVHHFLQFGTAPANGAAIAVTFSAGESVSYMRSVYGNVGAGFSTALESPYGNGNVAYDPANPTAISSGLAFRATDDRAIKTWRFDEAKTRSFELRVSSLDPAGSGTPCLWLNFATNRMHRIMNAGIGGWHTEAFLNDTGLNNVSYVADWRPDIVILESGTNEENAYPAEKKAYVTRTGVSAASIIAEDTANWFRTITNTGGSNHTVQDIRVPITAVSRNSVTFDGTNATFNIEAGDIIVIGDYRNDTRRITARKVTGWNSGTRVATFAEPLTADDLAHISALDDLVGGYAFVIEPDRWGAALDGIVSFLRDVNPQVQIALGSSGVPNQFDRSLEGYREFLAARAAALDVDFVDFYAVTARWTYSQPTSIPYYLNASQSTTSTGAASYPLFNAAGGQPSDPSIRPFSVKVNGTERINQGCYVTGGRTKSWPAGTTNLSKAANGTGNWQFVVKPYTVVFTDNVPTAGATIAIGGQTLDWSSDDTHPSSTAGFRLFAQAVTGPLDRAAERALAKAFADKWG